jgi:hypothetical protein
MFILPHLKGLLSGNLGSAAFKGAGLDLKFAANKSLVDSISGNSLVSFTRAGSGTYAGSDGLIKTAVTNLLLRSEEFNDASWVKTGTTVSTNAVVAPNGTTTAETLIEDTSTGTHLTTQSITATISTVYTFSVFAKAASGTRSIRLLLPTSIFTTPGNCIFNLQTGTAGSLNSGITAASITAFPDGWYRCSIVSPASTAATAGSWTINLINSGAASYTGDGTSGLYLWGAQIEQSSTVGEYIPTTSTINSAPRFDHNPTTGESLGLLVEEARTNLWQWSNSATDGQTWNNVGTHLTLTAGQTSPAGDSSAIRAADVDNATSGTFLQRTTVAPALTAGTFVSYSIFIKPISIPNTIGLAIFANGTTDGVTGTFTVSGTAITGFTINTNGSGASGSASYIAYPNGWYRLTVSGIPSTVTMADCRVRINLGSYTRSTGTARFDWYGGQFENNAFASSYIPTTGTAGGVTRAADVASITGSNFSSFYNQTEGTVFGQFLRTASTNTQQGRVFSFSDGSNTNALEIYQTGGSNPSAQITATTGQALWTPSGFTVGTSIKEILGYKLNNSNASFNGSAETLDTVCNIPTVTQARIGDRQDGVRTLNGTIQRLTYWPTRLADTTLQQITQP